MKYRDQWRGIMEWKNENLSFATSSNEACKLYDAALTQCVAMYEDPSFGGLELTLNKMLEADPEFVMGYCLQIGLQLVTGNKASIYSDEGLKKSVENLESLAKKNPDLTERQLNHVRAVGLYARNNWKEAFDLWDKILLDHPTDMHALKLAYILCVQTGLKQEMKDMVARILPFWQSTSFPLKCYLYGMYAFGLSENGCYKQAETYALKGLEMNPNDAWATHALAHVYEMNNKFEEGLLFLSKTEDDWKFCNIISCHIYWHMAVFMIENNDYEGAMNVWRNHIYPLAIKKQGTLDIADVASILYRVELTGPNNLVSKVDWQNSFNVGKRLIKSHSFGFYDAHLLMLCLGSDHLNEAEDFVESIPSLNFPYTDTTESLCKAIMAYHNKQYNETVNFLYSIRYKLVHVGGSEAQRDIFNQLLIVAALKSSLDFNRKLAEQLLIEREANKPDSPLTNRLLIRLAEK